jgi:anthranilate phosphoribosyltransferase
MLLSSIKLSGLKLEKQMARELLAAESYDLKGRSRGHEYLFELLSNTRISELFKKVVHANEDLSFEEAFCGMCYVLAATNSHFFDLYKPEFEKACGEGFTKDSALGLASVFMALMAMKEVKNQLTPEEIAGMVTASMLDVVVTLDLPQVIETCGMGGDKGFHGPKRLKSINASTLSALVLADLGLPSVKHGSYANTSPVGSTETIERFGANTSPKSKDEVIKVLQTSGFCFFDAHWCKTLHDLSHCLRMETINHVIGPMTPPLSPNTQINKVMGVNEKVHPATVAQAYALLHKKGQQKIGGVLVLCGLDEAGQNVVTDEISPFSTTVSATIGEKFLGTCTITPEDFGTSIDLEEILIHGDGNAVQRANVAALSAENAALADYLAMNAAMGLYAFDYLKRLDGFGSKGLNRQYLREAYKRCRQSINSGGAVSLLTRYVQATGSKVILN